MAKKGLEDITFILVIVLMFMVSYLFFHKNGPIGHTSKMNIEPPLSDANIIRNGPIPAVPVNIETRRMNTTNTQLGFLRLEKGGSDSKSPTRDALILPLMGRRLTTTNEKWYYYTISNTGVINTPLPIWINGRKCTNERGSDILQCGDRVFVEGYDNAFIVSLYENERITYIPYI